MDSAFDIVSKDKVLGKLAHHHRLLSIIRESSQTLLGQLHHAITIVDMREGVLLLETSNPIWVSEIKRYEKMVLGRLATILDNKLGKECPRISSIKVIIALKKPQYKGLDKKDDYTRDKEGSLEIMVANENKMKLEKGFAWCTCCGDILTDEKVCAFCRSEGKVI
jgi:hypothetical protein